MQLKRNYIDKLDFLKAFKPARAATLYLSNIRSEFAAAKLVLYNFKRVFLRF